MRRLGKAFEIEIKAPTLGLITRVSPDEPDVRATAAASNMRYEKGVMRNANGMQAVVPSAPLDSPANLLFQTQFLDPARNAGVLGTARKLYSIRAPVIPQALSLAEIYDFGGDIADVRNRTVAVSFINRTLFAQPNYALLYWEGTGGNAAIVHGLDPDSRWDGVNTFRDYVVIWRGSTLKWCAPNDVFNWIPVGATATSAVLNTTAVFTVPGVGAETDWIYVDSATAALLAIDQFMRFSLNGTTTFLNVTEVLPSTGQTGIASGFVQTVPAGTQQNIFTNAFVPYATGGRIYFRNSPGILEVQRDAVNPGNSTVTVAVDFVIPPAGGTVTVRLSATPPYALGTYISIGYGATPGADVYQVKAVNGFTNEMELIYTGVGSTHAVLHIAGEFVVPQPFVTVLNTSGAAAVSTFAEEILELDGFKGEVSDLTGAAPAGTVVPVGTAIFSVDANGAGELVNAGSDANGPILWFDYIGDYGCILKNRSIQSVQYVGPGQGTFFIRTEVSDEGLIGRYAFVKVGLDAIFIFGNREIYKYLGGKQLVPVARQHSVQVFAELDKAQTDRIIGYHNETDFEVWFVYPVKGQLVGDSAYRVLIYNYVEDSCTIDDYDPSAHPDLTLHGITALGRLDLSPTPTWEESTGTWVAPGNWPAEATWQDLRSSAAQNFSVAGFQENEADDVDGPSLALLNQGYDRNGHATLCSSESVDFSGDDPQLMKYADTLQIALQVENLVEAENPYVISIQLGSRPNLDSDLVWSNPVMLPVQGNGKYVTSVNIRRTGRYLRLRISSNQVGCGWRISRLALQGRLGGAY